MKKLLIGIAALAASTLNAAVIRTAAPTYAQVAGVSNQVMQVQNDVDILSSMILGNELASPYLAGLRVTFNVGPNAYVPEGDNYYKSIAGAYLTVQAPNELYKIDITDITAGAVKRVYVPCQSSVDVDVRLHLGPADHIYPSGTQTVHLHRQQVTDVVIDTHPPLVPPSGQEDAYRMVDDMASPPTALRGSVAMRLGRAYEEGEGCKADYATALQWYETAVLALQDAVDNGGWFCDVDLGRAIRGAKRMRQELALSQ